MNELIPRRETVLILLLFVWSAFCASAHSQQFYKTDDGRYVEAKLPPYLNGPNGPYLPTAQERAELYANADLVEERRIQSVQQTQGNCYVDPYTGQTICNRPSYGWQPAYGGTRMIRDVPSPQSQVATLPRPWRCRISMGNGNVGSGSLIGRTQVITNQHVVEGSGGCSVMFPSGITVQGRVVATDPAYDLAMIEVPETGIEPAPINIAEPSGTLCAGGFGGDGRFRGVYGQVTGHVVYTGATIPCPKMSGTARSGDSGGGVTNQSKEFVGVLWGTRNGEIYMTCGRPLASFLDRVLPDRTGAIIARATPRSYGSPGGQYQGQQPGSWRPQPQPEPYRPPAIDQPPEIYGPQPTIDPEAWEEWEQQQQQLKEGQAQLQQQLQSLVVKVESIEGKQGPPGPPGPKGDPGATPQINYQELADNIQIVDKPFYIRVRNPKTGEVSPYATVQDGQYVTLDLVPEQ